MAAAFIILRQIAVMAMLITIGILLSRMGYLSEQGAKEIGAILIRVVIPVVIIKSFITEYSRERAMQLALSFLLALTGYVLSMLVSWFAFGKDKKIENCASALCNSGFIGIPLAQAFVGDEGVFLVASSVALSNLFQWTYGVFVMTGRREAISAKSLVKNPVLTPLLLGILLFFTQLPVPEILVTTMGYVAGMNTSMAMLLLGTYLARLPLKQILLDRRAYRCVAFRLLVIPAVTLLVFALLPVPDKTVAMTIFLAAITPVAANVCVFAQQNNCDYELSVITVCLSTLLSVVTIPLFVSLGQAFI